MIKLFFLIASLVITTGVSSEQHSNQHLHSRVGSHGMVLTTDGNELYASHMPLYRSPHDYQLIYLVKSTNKAALISYLSHHNITEKSASSNKMLTILPSNFDLNILVEGQELTTDMTVFKGHFERGATVWLEDQTIKFVRPVYRRALANLPVATDNKEQWQRITNGSNGTQIWVHKIKLRPSFDAIVLTKGCVKALATLSIIETENRLADINNAFSHCEDHTILYFETADFSL